MTETGELISRMKAKLLEQDKALREMLNFTRQLQFALVAEKEKNRNLEDRLLRANKALMTVTSEFAKKLSE